MHSAIPASVTVSAPARLHLGFLDLSGGLGRRFGSIGLAISDLGTRITFHSAPTLHVIGPERDRVRRHVDTMQHALDTDLACNISIEQIVPAHVGLGSGTQIALAVAAGVRALHGLAPDVRYDALRLGRGARSGAGIGLFEYGGLVVDGGKGPLTEVAPIISRLPFPDDWRVLVVLDPIRQGIHGSDESSAFTSLPPFPDDIAAHLCRLTVMKLLPSLVEHDLAGFGSAIKDLQNHLGDYFAAAQGSRFTSPDVAAALDLLEQEGAVGIGQSSWGPTGFAFAPSDMEAERLLQIVRRHPAGRRLNIRACLGLNRGAEITTRAVAGVANQ
jgi:beta-RFAP synthase